MKPSDRLRQIADLARAVSGALEPDAVLRQVTAAAVSLRPALRAAVRLVDEEARGYRLAGAGGEGAAELAPLLPFGQGLTHVVAESRRPLLVSDVGEDERAALESWPAAPGLAVYYGAPIEARGRLLGVLSANFPRGAGPSPDEQELIQLLAAQAAIALENARLHEAAVRRERTLTGLLRASRALMGGRDLDRTLDHILEEASAIAGTACVEVFLLDPAAGVLRVAAARHSRMPVGWEVPADRGLSGTVVATGRPCFAADMSRDPANLFARRDREAGLVTYLGLPIATSGTVLGVLAFITTSPRRYSEEEVAHLSIFADQAGLAITSARELAGETAARLERQTVSARLQMILDRMPVGCIVHDADFRFLYWNPAAERIFGYRSEDVIGQLPYGLITPPERQEAVAGMFRRLAAGELPAPATAESLTRDGRLIMCEWHNTPLVGPDGAFVGVISMCLDVSERDRSEAARRTSEERYRAIVDGSIQAIVVHVGGVIRFANPALTRVIGYEPQELIGRSAASFVAPADRERLLAYRDARERGEGAPSRYEFRAVRRDGTMVWLDSTVTPVTWDGAAATLATMVDVTERKSLEEQLRQSQKMEAVGRLAGGVAHDFNNLLTVVVGRGQLLLDRLPPGDPTRREIELIHATSQRATALTRQLLAFGRRQILQPQVLDLRELVAGLEPLLRRLIGEDVDLTVTGDPNRGAVEADPNQIEQVILNLVVNARDAMPRGGQLTVEVRNADLDAAYTRRHVGAQAGPHVMLAVSDTGVGMDEATLARIFEPFFTTKEQGRGTGLGLATVYGIVKQSGGHVWVYSEPGRGTVLKVYLPRVGAGATAAVAEDQQAAPGSGHETILLVEDDAEVRSLTHEILDTWGYRVLEASHGGEALEVAAGEPGPLHLLVTDVVMPGMSGRDLALRLAEQRPGLRVLYMSGYTDEAIVNHGVLDPGLAFLGKPFSLDALARKVREVLDG